MESTGNKSDTHLEIISDKQLKLTGSHKLNIYYEDTDHSGYVYHANYLRFFERARSELIGVKLVKEFYNKSVHYVVAGANLRYKKPAHYGDSLVVKTEFNVSESPRSLVKQSIYRENGEKPIVTGEIELVLVGANGKPITPPDHVFESLKNKFQK